MCDYASHQRRLSRGFRARIRVDFRGCGARAVEFGFFFFFSSRRRHTRYWRDWSSDVCSSDLGEAYEYKRWVLVAWPRGSRRRQRRGLFGFGGGQVSGSEVATINELGAAIEV